MIVVLSVVVLCIVVFPVFWLLNISFLSQGGLFTEIPTISFFGEFFSAKGYAEVLLEPDIYIWIRNSVLVSVGAVAVSVFCAVLGGYALSRFRTNRNKVFLTMIICTQMIAPALIVGPAYIIFSQVGLTNSLIGLVILDSALVLAFAIWMMKGFLDGIPRELDEAAMIDGCNHFQVLTKIIIPIALPSIMTIVVINFFDIYNEYMFAMTFITSESKFLSPVGLSTNSSRVGLDWAHLLPQAVITCIIPITFYFIFQRYVVKGISAGALKG